MELYIRRLLNNVYVEDKCSLFGDEEIELTKGWNEQQIISGYGSYSRTFSIPADENNRKLFNFYDIIGGAFIGSTAFIEADNNMNPQYNLPARLVTNEFEIIGNVQLVSFTTKNMVNYTFNVTFYGEEKNLLKELNRTDVGSVNKPKLNDLDLGDINFDFDFNNVVGSWYQEDTFWFAPLMATTRPLNYRADQEPNNINALAGGTQNTTGVTMTDLAVSYNFKQLLDRMFDNHNIDVVHSDEISKFLKDLYVMPNSKIEFGLEMLLYNFDVWKDYTRLYSGALRNILKFTSYSSSNRDTANYNTTYDYYTIPNTGTYDITLNFNYFSKYFIAFGVQGFDVYVINYDTGVLIKHSTFSPPGVQYITANFTAGDNIQFLISYRYKKINFPVGWYNEVYTGTFTDYTISGLNKVSMSSGLTYSYSKSVINFPDMLFSDFFVHFCKSFNIFFKYVENDIVQQKSKVVYTYLKDDLDRTSYDLSQYLLLDKNYTFNNNTKYKLIDYKFAEAKDINNLAYVQSNVLAYGQNKSYYNYDFGIDKLEYKSIFTVFPRTTLNYTDTDNTVLSDTEIPLHSELSETYSALNTDFLLMYKLPAVSGLPYYNIIANDAGAYLAIDFASNYGPEGPSGYTLDYNTLDVIKDNLSVQYETTMDFLLPSETVHNIKVYDYVLVHNIWYEIKELNTNVRNGLTSIKMLTVPIPIVLQPSPLYEFDIKYASDSGVCAGTAYTVYSYYETPTIGTKIFIDSNLTTGFTLGDWVVFNDEAVYSYEAIVVDTSVNEGMLLGLTGVRCEPPVTFTITNPTPGDTFCLHDILIENIEGGDANFEYQIASEDGGTFPAEVFFASETGATSAPFWSDIMDYNYTPGAPGSPWAEGQEVWIAIRNKNNTDNVGTNSTNLFCSSVTIYLIQEFSSGEDDTWTLKYSVAADSPIYDTFTITHPDALSDAGAPVSQDIVMNGYDGYVHFVYYRLEEDTSVTCFFNPLPTGFTVATSAVTYTVPHWIVPNYYSYYYNTYNCLCQNTGPTNALISTQPLVEGKWYYVGIDQDIQVAQITGGTPNYTGTTFSGPYIPYDTCAEVANCALPTVTTSGITNITYSGGSIATGGGDVTDQGGAPVTTRGVCWNTSTNPDITDEFVASNSGLGTYQVLLESLTIGSTYYVRAFATNSNGTAYGDNVQFVATGPSTVSAITFSTNSTLSNWTIGSGVYAPTNTGADLHWEIYGAVSTSYDGNVPTFNFSTPGRKYGVITSTDKLTGLTFLSFERLDIFDDWCYDFNINNAPNLKKFYISVSGMTGVTFTNNVDLTDLRIFNGPTITSINLSNQTNLATLKLNNTLISSVDITNHPLIRSLFLQYNPNMVDYVDISAQINMLYLWCEYNYFTEAAQNAMIQDVIDNNPSPGHFNMRYSLGGGCINWWLRDDLAVLGWVVYYNQCPY